MDYLEVVIELVVALGSVVGVILTAKANFNKINAELDKRIEVMQKDQTLRNEALNKDITRLSNDVSQINAELKQTNTFAIKMKEMEGDIKLLKQEINFIKGGK